MFFLVHTRSIFELNELSERFELPITSSFNVLRERIAKFLDFKIPVNSETNIQPLEFIRLYDMEDEQPTTIVHEPALSTLKKVRDLCGYAFEILSHPECLAKKDFLLNIVHSKDHAKNYFQEQFELHWPLKDNPVAKYECLQNLILSHLDRSINSNPITIARYIPERGHWIIIDPLSMNNKKAKNSPGNLKLEPYKLTDLTVIGVLPGEHLVADDFDSEYDKNKRQGIDQEKDQKRTTRERNRADNERNQQNGSSGRRKSPQNTMRIDVDDFDS